MNQNDRQRLVSMVRGENGRELLVRFYPTDGKPRQEFIKVEGDLPSPDPSNPFRFLLGCRPQDREQVLGESPCLVRQDDGRFVAVNPEGRGFACLID